MRNRFFKGAFILTGFLLVAACSDRGNEIETKPVELPIIKGNEVEVGNKPLIEADYQHIVIKNVSYKLIHEKDSAIIRILDTEIFDINTPDFYKTAEYYEQIGDDKTASYYRHQKVNEKAVKKFSNIVEALATLPAKTSIEIQTHLHNMDAPSEKINEITEARAKKLLERFSNEEKLSHISFSAKSFGDTAPVYPNNDVEFRINNSRIDLVVTQEK